VDSLDDEIATGVKWVYPWRLNDGRELEVVGETIAAVHATRTRLIEPMVRDALEAAGGGAVALDLACNEGWFSHRLLEWGASKVVGVDVRESNVRRARLLRDHYGIPEERFEVVQADVFNLDPEQLGQFDVVLVLGLIYHVEEPTRVLRLARACTRGVCAVETQLTRQTEPIVLGWGTPDHTEQAEASFAVLVESGEMAMTSLAATGGVLSLIPNRSALIEMLRVAGFAQWDFPDVSSDDEPQYAHGDRAVVIAQP
jgi:ubiquinone/menaquinone biosynthesis C-methylase UbiE